MRRPSPSELQRIKEKAELHGRWDIVEKVIETKQRRAEELADPPAPPQEPQNNGLSDDSFSVDSISARISSTAAEHTSLALKKVSESDYNYRCTSCKAKPPVAGPHHDHSCSKNQDTLTISSNLAHKHDCKHCGARPYVAGAHHRRDCPRRVKKHVNNDPAKNKYNYTNTCKNCGAKPFSQGSHHSADCKRHWSYTAYATKLAHKYKCTYCDARPFVAGPHHQSSCDRYIL